MSLFDLLEKVYAARFVCVQRYPIQVYFKRHSVNIFIRPPAVRIVFTVADYLFGDGYTALCMFQW